MSHKLGGNFIGGNFVGDTPMVEIRKGGSLIWQSAYNQVSNSQTGWSADGTFAPDFGSPSVINNGNAGDMNGAALLRGVASSTINEDNFLDLYSPSFSFAGGLQSTVSVHARIAFAYSSSAGNGNEFIITLEQNDGSGWLPVPGSTGGQNTEGSYVFTSDPDPLFGTLFRVAIRLFVPSTGQSSGTQHGIQCKYLQVAQTFEE